MKRIAKMSLFNYLEGKFRALLLTSSKDGVTQSIHLQSEGKSPLRNFINHPPKI